MELAYLALKSQARIELSEGQPQIELNSWKQLEVLPPQPAPPSRLRILRGGTQSSCPPAGKAPRRRSGVSECLLSRFRSFSYRLPLARRRDLAESADAEEKAGIKLGS